MKERVISGFFIAIFTALFCYLGGFYLAIVLTVLSIMAYYELTKSTGMLKTNEKTNPLQIINSIGIVFYYVFAYFTEDKEILLLIIVSMFIVNLFVYVVSYPRYDSKMVFSSFYSFVYGPVMLSFVLLVRMFSNKLDTENFNIGFFFVWFIIIAAWFSDTCAYFVGVLFGKHKIFPNLSPKKTVEGCIGGIAGSVIGFFVYSLILYKFNIIDINTVYLSIILGILGSIISQIGDLAASAIKRNNDIKDYANLIPGHGGIMDRFDSIIIVSPLIYILCTVFFKFI